MGGSCDAELTAGNAARDRSDTRRPSATIASPRLPTRILRGEVQLARLLSTRAAQEAIRLYSELLVDETTNSICCWRADEAMPGKDAVGVQADLAAVTRLLPEVR